MPRRAAFVLLALLVLLVPFQSGPRLMPSRSPGSTVAPTLDGALSSGSSLSGVWIESPPPPVAVADMPAAQCSTGAVTYVYLVGGYKEWVYGNPSLEISANNLQQYNPGSGTWAQKATLPLAAWGGSAASYNGKIYYFSGVYLNRREVVTGSKETQIYDCSTNAWTVANTRTPFGGAGSMAVTYGDLIYVQMGRSLWAYNPASDTWTQKASDPNSKRWSTFALVGSRIYAVGGYDGRRAVASMDTYDIPTNTWTADYATAPYAAWGMARESVVIGGSIVYAFGLTSGYGSFVSHAYLYNLTTQSWLTMPNAHYPRDGIAGTVLGNRFYALGGRNNVKTPQGLSYNEQLTVTFSTPYQLVATANAEPLAVDIGRTVNFTCKATGGVAPPSYAWSFGDGTSGTGQTHAHVYASSGARTATCTVVDQGGTTARSSVVVTVCPAPYVSASVNHAAAATGVQLTFVASAAGGSGSFTSYEWSFGDGTTGAGATVTQTYGQAGTFTASVTVTDSNGGSATGSVAVTISKLVVRAGVSATSVAVGLPITFTAATSGGGGSPYTFQWDFGDGTAGFGSPASHSYAKAGLYTPSVKVRDSLGATTATVLATIMVGEPPGPLGGVPSGSGGLQIPALVLGAALAVVLGWSLLRRITRAGQAGPPPAEQGDPESHGEGPPMPP